MPRSERRILAPPRNKPWNGVSYRFDACECGLAAPCAICNDLEGEGSSEF